MTSIRSRSGAGIGSSMFAVAMKSTFERSNGTDRKWSLKSEFCSGSSTSSSAADGSPRKSAPSLSISSSMKTGLLVPACLSACTMRPGIAPT